MTVPPLINVVNTARGIVRRSTLPAVMHSSRKKSCDQVERMDLNQMLDATTFPDWEALKTRRRRLLMMIIGLFTNANCPRPSVRCCGVAQT